MGLVQFLGLNVRRVRMAKGFSQQRLGEESGLERSYVSDLERGTRNPSVQALERLAIALEVDPAELLRRLEAESEGSAE